MTVSKTKAKLVDVARQLFAKMGVENTTMNDIALASKKGRRTLYTYFKSKEDIYLAVVESELDILSDMMKHVVEKDIQPDEKLMEMIYTHLDAVKEVVFRNGTLRANFFRDIWRVEKVRKRFDATETQLFKEVLREGMEKLEGMQAGLSWLTILNKREAFRIAFDNFDCKKIALYDDAKIEKLMQNSRIVRNRLKIKSAITNAQQFIKIQELYGSFDSFIWSYVDGKPILNQFQTETDIPAKTALSDQISKDLKKLGFKFVGSTIIYAYMQAIGIVNDHVKGCHLYANK